MMFRAEFVLMLDELNPFVCFLCLCVVRSALTPNKAASTTFKAGSSCSPCNSNGGHGRGKARCWKRVMCYIDLGHAARPLENQVGATKLCEPGTDVWFIVLMVIVGLVGLVGIGCLVLVVMGYRWTPVGCRRIVPSSNAGNGEMQMRTMQQAPVVAVPVPVPYSAPSVTTGTVVAVY